MELLLQNIDWLAVVGGGIVSFLVGWLWYSPKLFGIKWAAGVGVDITDASGASVMGMATQLFGTAALAWTIGVMMALELLPLVILMGFAITGLIKANGFFARKSMYAIGVESGFIAVMMIIMVLAHFAM